MSQSKVGEIDDVTSLLIDGKRYVAVGLVQWYLEPVWLMLMLQDSSGMSHNYLKSGNK